MQKIGRQYKGQAVTGLTEKFPAIGSKLGQQGAIAAGKIGFLLQPIQDLQKFIMDQTRPVAGLAQTQPPELLPAFMFVACQGFRKIAGAISKQHFRQPGIVEPEFDAG